MIRGLRIWWAFGGQRSSDYCECLPCGCSGLLGVFWRSISENELHRSIRTIRENHSNLFRNLSIPRCSLLLHMYKTIYYMLIAIMVEMRYNINTTTIKQKNIGQKPYGQRSKVAQSRIVREYESCGIQICLQIQRIQRRRRKSTTGVCILNKRN